jgi:hypothetical protein
MEKLWNWSCFPSSWSAMNWQQWFILDSRLYTPVFLELFVWKRPAFHIIFMHISMSFFGKSVKSCIYHKVRAQLNAHTMHGGMFIHWCYDGVSHPCLFCKIGQFSFPLADMCKPGSSGQFWLAVSVAALTTVSSWKNMRRLVCVEFTGIRKYSQQ